MVVLVAFVVLARAVILIVMLLKVAVTAVNCDLRDRYAALRIRVLIHHRYGHSPSQIAFPRRLLCRISRNILRYLGWAGVLDRLSLIDGAG